MTMRVCSPQIGVDPESHLGGAVYDRELLKAMVGLGASVDVLLPAGSPVDASVGWNITWTARHRYTYYEYNWIFHTALRRHWKDRPADVLRVHSPYSVGPGALVFARRYRVPAVLHYLHREPRLLWTAVDRSTLSRYDLIVTISEATRRDLLAYGLPDSRIVVAYPGVDDRFAPQPHECAPTGATRALYVGGLLARKNLMLALRGVARARAQGVEVELTVAGAGDQDGALRAEASRLGLASAVRFLGAVDEPSKLHLLQTADLFVFPSTLEGFGMAAVEALACEVPVIAMCTTSTAEIVRDGRTGILLRDPTDVDAMAAAIRALSASPDTRRRMGVAGREDVRSRFSWNASAARVLDAYSSVTDRVSAE